MENPTVHDDNKIDADQLVRELEQKDKLERARAAGADSDSSDDSSDSDSDYEHEAPEIEEAKAPGHTRYQLEPKTYDPTKKEGLNLRRFMIDVKPLDSILADNNDVLPVCKTLLTVRTSVVHTTASTSSTDSGKRKRPTIEDDDQDEEEEKPYEPPKKKPKDSLLNEEEHRAFRKETKAKRRGQQQQQEGFRFREYVIKLFSFWLARPDMTWVCYGKRRTGKSTFLDWFLYVTRCWWPEVIVFTRTKDDGEWQKRVPDKYVIEGFDENVIRRLIARQRVRIKRLREGRINNENIYVLLVLDDIITDNLRKRGTLDELFFLGRHLYMGIIIASQDSKALMPSLRANTDMVGVFPVRSERDKDAVLTNYLDFLKNRKEYDELVEEVQRIPYLMMVIDQSHPIMDPAETVYAGVVPPKSKIPGYFLGTRLFWKGSEEQLYKLGGQEWLAHDDWHILQHTYHFNW